MTPFSAAVKRALQISPPFTCSGFEKKNTVSLRLLYRTLIDEARIRPEHRCPAEMSLWTWESCFASLPYYERGGADQTWPPIHKQNIGHDNRCSTDNSRIHRFILRKTFYPDKRIQITFRKGCLTGKLFAKKWSKHLQQTYLLPSVLTKEKSALSGTARSLSACLKDLLW